MGYPPVLQFMSCKIASLDEEKAVYISEEIKKITAGFAEDTRIIGPGNAPVYKINDIYYRIIYYKNSSHERLEEINENAYMNGYNWEALLSCYAEHYCPELLDSFEPDSEAGMYAAVFEGSPEGEKNAEKLANNKFNRDTSYLDLLKIIDNI